MEHQCVFMRLDVPRQPVLILEGHIHAAKPEGTQAGERGSLCLVLSTGARLNGHLAVCPNMHTLACQSKPLVGFRDTCFTGPS